MHSLTRTLTLLLVLVLPAVAFSQSYHDRNGGRDDRDYREDRWDDRWDDDDDGDRWDDRYDYDDDREGYVEYDRRHRRYGRYKGHTIKIPKGHYPPPGLCRVWHPNRPPGHQPPPVPCGRLNGKHFGRAVVVTHHGVFHTWSHGHRYYDASRRHRRAHLKKSKRTLKKRTPRRYRKLHRHGPKARIRVDIGGVWVF